MKIIDINKVPIRTRLYDKNGREALDGDIIKSGNGDISEVYWDERFQWSVRDSKPNKYGAINFHHSLTSSKFIVPENSHWEIIERK